MCGVGESMESSYILFRFLPLSIMQSYGYQVFCSPARLHVMAVVTEGGFQNDLVFVFVFVFVSLNLFHVFGLFVCIKCAAPAPPCLCFCLPVDYVVGSQWQLEDNAAGPRNLIPSNIFSLSPHSQVSWATRINSRWRITCGKKTSLGESDDFS